MTETTLREVYIEQLRDLYDAENQLIKALPKMAKAAESPELRSGFEHHLEQTRGHAGRIEEIFSSMGESKKRKKCKGMQGLVDEGGEVIGDDLEGPAKDAALIAAAQRVEHYEIAGYGSVRSFAEELGETQAASLLQQTLDEEKETDGKLTQLSEQINPQALNGSAVRESSRARRAV